MTKERIKIGLCPITNEIIPQRAYPALLDPEITPYFEVTAFAGIPPGSEIISRLEKEIEKRESYPTKWRSKQTKIEIASLYDFITRIKQGLPYFQINTNKSSIPEEFYKLCDCVFIGTNNLTHAQYAIDAFKHNKHSITEKPYAVTRKDLSAVKSLEELIQFQKEKTGLNLVRKITAHFAHKPVSLTLFGKIDELVEHYGKISRVECFYEELDDPLKPRTIATLNFPTSGGGIYQDTGCHMEMILLALGAKVELGARAKEKDSFEWDQYKGYGVETYAKVKHKISGKRFVDNSDLEITVSKFADKYETPASEHKELLLTLNKGYKAHVQFSEGKIEIKKLHKNGRGEREEEKPTETIKEDYPSNEYVSIFKDFNKCILTGQESFTSPQRGIEAMEIILFVYENFLNPKNRTKKYRY